MEIPRDVETGDRLVVEVFVAGRHISLILSRDHLAAHADDLLLSWDELVDSIAQGIEQHLGVAGSVNVGYLLAQDVGYSGVIEIGPGDGAFWACRPQRQIPSHLVIGEKSLTRELCIWGRWVDTEVFEVFTCYPGAPAPKEIHDPTLEHDKIDESIAFWSSRAIVVDKDQADELRSEDVR